MGFKHQFRLRIRKKYFNINFSMYDTEKETLMNIEDLRRNLSYDPGTGDVRWIRSGHGRDLQSLAGVVDKRKGVRRIQFNKKHYNASVIAWALHYGELPGKWVIHLNADKSDTRLCNLMLYSDETPVETPVETRRLIKPMLHDPSTRDEWIRENCRYDKETGFIYVKICGEETRREKVRVSNGKQYLVSFLCGANTASHRVAWFLHTGSWPVSFVDHIDHDGLNNRIENLRDVSHTENLRNAKRSRASKTGVTGVQHHSGGKGFVATIGCGGGRQRYLGLFKTIEAAAEARKKAEVELGYHPNHGK